jgi:hypothetical protein
MVLDLYRFAAQVQVHIWLVTMVQHASLVAREGRPAVLGDFHETLLELLL